MQYLFNKIYLSLDNAYEIATDCILISEAVNTLPEGEFETEVLQADLGTIHIQGASYADAIASVGGEQQFFDFLANFPGDRKLIIYANAPAYVEILAKWYKSLLTQLDQDTAYTTLHLSVTRIAHIMGYPYTNNKRLSESDAAEYRALRYQLPARSAFDAWWDALTPYDLSIRGYQSFAEAAALEFLIASYFVNADSLVTPALRTRVQTLAHTALIEWALDWFEYALGQPSILPGFDIQTQTVEQWTEQHPQYKMIGDPLLFPNDIQYALQTYEPSAILSTGLQIIEWVGYDTQLQYSLEGLWDVREVVLEDILAYEVAHPLHSTILAIGGRSTLINTYLLNRLYIERRNGTTELASRLQLIEK